jgi:hypothetical protein
MKVPPVLVFLSFQILPVVFVVVAVAPLIVGCNPAFFISTSATNVGSTVSNNSPYTTTTPLRAGLEFASFFFLVGLIPSIYFTKRSIMENV